MFSIYQQLSATERYEGCERVFDKFCNKSSPALLVRHLYSNRVVGDMFFFLIRKTCYQMPFQILCINIEVYFAERSNRSLTQNRRCKISTFCLEKCFISLVENRLRQKGTITSFNLGSFNNTWTPR